jgi:hypothetical protein
MCVRVYSAQLFDIFLLNSVLGSAVNFVGRNDFVDTGLLSPYF